MLNGPQHLEAARNARTYRDIHRWLVNVRDDQKMTYEVRDICRVFALELETLLSTTVLRSDISSRIWNVFRRLVVAVSMKPQ